MTIYTRITLLLTGAAFGAVAATLSMIAGYTQ